MNYLDLMHKRFACKEFNEQRISDANIHAILQAGILSPSSLGLEPWTFYVFSKRADILALGEFANSKKQFETCSHAILISAKRDYSPTGATVKTALSRRNDFDKILAIYAPFLERLAHRDAHEYGALQTYIAATNMINCATSLGIDSCWIGGYDEAPINAKFLPKDEFAGTILTFGYRKSEPKREKTRFEFHQKVKFI